MMLEEFQPADAQLASVSVLLCRRFASTEMGKDVGSLSQKQNGLQLALHASSCMAVAST